MEQHEAQDIIACLLRGRTPFYYFRDRYALMLLSYCVRDPKPIREIRRSRFARLLSRPLVKQLLDARGSGVLSADDLGSAWPLESECYLLTLGLWGAEKKKWNRYYHQTSRPGVNLVLQLNFSSKHNRPYDRLIEPGDRRPFEYDCHPIARDGYHTLAWARLDVDLDAGEVLIEEVQSDWIRLVERRRFMVEAYGRASERRRRMIERRFDGRVPDLRKLDAYVTDVLAGHAPVWPEAMLAAAVWFIREELGLTRIYYHTFSGGNFLKRLDYGTPPRSLYTDLPRRFCFEKTPTAPGFLESAIRRRLRRAKKPIRVLFWRMELPR